MWIKPKVPLRSGVIFDIMSMFSVVDITFCQQCYQQPVDIFVNNFQAL
ncbi:hypothetical protein KNP414_07976 [Paenibacillus mucilaginosus KNP414]|uniref:Uncharacterized protein n=1 Tax=Paenibacillus mucilaginosus (strain KNP414) TaxID=1036673 RepID=F8FKU2_PAEMK|nr:hypothetical protein KNP414_07976 [Paenibacillus mucilaginosus KNP414]